MLQSIEQLVTDLANAPTGTAAGETKSVGDPLGPMPAPGQSVEGIDVNLPNGYSAEIYHLDSTETGSMNGDDLSKEMSDTMEQLVGALSTYPAAAASAYGRTATNSTSTTTSLGNIA